MKSTWRTFLFLVVVALVFSITLIAHAEIVDLPSGAYYFILSHNDTIHLWGDTKGTGTSSDVQAPYVCYELNAEHQLVPCTNGCASFFQSYVSNPPESGMPYRFFGPITSPQNETYMVMRDFEIYRWTPDMDTPWTHVCSLDMTGIDPIKDIAYDFYAANDNTLYASFSPLSQLRDSGSRENSVLYAFDLSTGSRRQLCSYYSITTLSIGHHNTILFAGALTSTSTKGNLYAYDLNSGETTMFIEYSPYIFDGFIPDNQGNWYSAISDTAQSGVYRTDKDGKQTLLVDLPKGSNNNAYKFILSADKQTIYCQDQKLLHIIPLSASAIPAQANTLRISLPHDDERLNNFLPSDNDFRVQHPGVSVRQDYLPPDETAQSLITGSDTYDLLIIDPLFTDFSAMLEKGYYTDLSDIPEVADYMARLYPVWTAECTHNGQLAALPVGVMSGFSLEYNKRIWEEEALGDVPTTYEELFDFVEQWMDSDLATTYPLFGPMKDTFGLLLDRLLSDYISLGERQGELLPFHDERLLNLLARLESLRPQLERLEMQYNSGDPLFYENGSVTFLSHLFVATQITDYASMPLALWQDATPVVPASLYVMVINPRSTKQDLAKDYLVNITRHPTTTTQCVLLQGQPQGIPYSAADQANMEAQMEEIKVEIALAQSEHDPDRELALEQNLSELTRSYLQSWDIMPNAAAKLYAVTPYWAILHKQGYGFIQRNAYPLLKAYQDNQLSAETLTRRIDQLIEMERMEDQ